MKEFEVTYNRPELASAHDQMWLYRFPEAIQPAARSGRFYWPSDTDRYELRFVCEIQSWVPGGRRFVQEIGRSYVQDPAGVPVADEVIVLGGVRVLVVEVSCQGVSYELVVKEAWG